jgi:hypothetical protein
VQAATAELSVLIERAKALLAHQDPNMSGEMQRLLLGSHPAPPRSEALPSTLLPVQEDHSVRA